MLKALSQGRIAMDGVPLWAHQKTAVKAIRDYLSACAKKMDIGAALVNMPTGTGKTGVIAVCSHLLEEVDCVLLLAPRVALRDQLAREVAGRFFTKLGLDATHLPKGVKNIKRGFPTVAQEDLSSTVFVMTIQMLHSAAGRNSSAFRVLRDAVEMVVVDEGHYEPAISWREAIRSFSVPRVIFTATPFRNDLKLFDINFDHAFSYTFNEAVSDKVIRKVKVYPRPHPGSPQAFVKEIVRFYDERLRPGRRNKGDPPRVIIRCDSQAEIRQIGRALGSEGRSYVLIHENFRDGDPQYPCEYCAVPDTKDQDAVFWVHQFKLLEGIDDPRFRLLALYKELRNTRQFVQQVGRVIRNPHRKSGATAYVLDHSNGRQKELWDDYLAFDKRLRLEGVRVAEFGEKLLDEMAKAQPGVVYVGGRFRTPFNMTSVDPATELLMPLTMNIFDKSDTFDMKRLCDEIASEFDEQDRAFRRAVIDGHTHVFLYLAFRNSPLLRTKCFMECRLGATVLREAGPYLCCFDSGGSLPVCVKEYVDAVPAAVLQRLFSRPKESYLTEVSLRNANLGPRVVRSRSITAARIQEIVPAFDDHAFVCQRARGYTQEEELVRRYVGFAKGKVTDASVNRVALADYIAWLKRVAATLSEEAPASNEFQRYAKPAGLPEDPEATSILLDLGEVEDRFLLNEELASEGKRRMVIEDACSEVQGSAFSITANGKKCSATVKFDAGAGSYFIESADLDGMYYSDDPNLDQGVVRYLNRNQSFRVIPRSEGSFYTLGEFYSPFLTFGKKYNDDQFGLLRIIRPEDCLKSVGSEKGKGTKPDGSGWERNTLFDIIDSLGMGYGLDNLFGSPDILVCDDMGTEAADFILADTRKERVVFIHAKGRETGHARLYGASSLQDVCGQATKNIKYLSRYGQEEPPNASKWHTRKWVGPKGLKGQVNTRIRKKPPSVTTGLHLWKAIRSIIRNPSADLEVWLFLGRLLSKSAFEEQLTAPHPAAEAKQAAYLLFSTMNDVASVGAKLRVICSP